MSNETGTHLGEESRPVSVSFLQVLYNVGIIPAREQYRDINKGVVRSGSSPRAPHGARLAWSKVQRLGWRFQSTRPVRSATGSSTSRQRVTTGFNPRAPHGARRWAVAQVLALVRFQSTRPARGATVNPCVSMNRYNFIYTIGENDDRGTCRSQETATFRVSFCANLQGLSHR